MARRQVARVEALHSALRRRIVGQRPQARHVDFTEIDAQWVLDRARSRAGHFHVETAADHGGSAAHPRGIGVSRPRRASAWRAFVRRRSLGKVGLPSMAELAQEYAELTDQQRRELDDIVEAASTRAAVCPLG